MPNAQAVTGSFEIHIFVEPLDPSPERAEAFTRACQGAPAPMKALLLFLDYVGKGFVGVLQSSRYVQGGVEEARAAAHGDAKVLEAAGFKVIREKVEAMAQNDGVPKVDADAAHESADRYFEFHVLIDRPGAALTGEDMVALRQVSAELSRRLGSPVPLSYNALKPSQRFLNFRARRVGLQTASEPGRFIEAQLKARGLVVKKAIAEYICFDSNRAVDDGWLEPLPGAAA